MGRNEIRILHIPSTFDVPVRCSTYIIDSVVGDPEMSNLRGQSPSCHSIHISIRRLKNSEVKIDVRSGIMCLHASLNQCNTRSPIPFTLFGKFGFLRRDRDVLSDRSSGDGSEHEVAAEEAHEVVLLWRESPDTAIYV